MIGGVDDGCTSIAAAADNNAVNHKESSANMLSNGIESKFSNHRGVISSQALISYDIESQLFARSI